MDGRAGQAERIEAAVAGAVAAGEVPGAAWWVGRHGEVVSRGAAGGHGTGAPVRPDTVFRISSMTKPVVAAVAMALVDDGALGVAAQPARRLRAGGWSPPSG